MKKLTFILTLCLAVQLAASAQSVTPAIVADVQGDARCQQWVDSVMKRLSLKERLGQLFIYTLSPREGVNKKQVKEKRDLLRRVVKNYEVGGLLLSEGSLAEYANLLNEAQRLAEVPLMITFDGEWGLAMRIKKESPFFPKNQTLGHIRDNRLIYDYGREVARQMKEMGVQVNFAPVADVNINPKNPVINVRSFGDDPVNVAEKVIAYSRGLEDGGVLSVSKHFPGHGDTDVDSHKVLPRLNFSRERLDSIELYPFRQAFAAGLGGVMVGHLEIPSLEPQVGLPSTLSRNVNRLLTEEMGFQGLVFTDALSMKGVSNHENVCLKALQAGNDLLLVPRKERFEKELDAILDAVKRGELSEDFIDKKCRKVLTYKYALGLSKKPHVQLSGLYERVNSPEAADLILRLKKAAKADSIRTAREKLLAAIDTIAMEGVREGAYPGCQVVVWKDGKEMYNKGFGHYTDEPGSTPMTTTAAFDLASLSKTTGTLMAVMKAYDKGLINLSDRLGDLLPFFKDTDKKDITVRDLLFHESGLPPTILFYMEAIDSTSYEAPIMRNTNKYPFTAQVDAKAWANPHFKFREGLVSPVPTVEHTMQISEGLWLSESFKPEFLQAIADAKLRDKRYRYSCVGFILLQHIVEARTHMKMDAFLQKEFYGPMGLTHTGYLPLRFLPQSEVVPSNVDPFLRKSTLQGFVHDESAAFQGGVSGNAGLFSNGGEVTRIYQMLLNDGELEGRRYLSKSTCKLFTTLTSKISRRGLGFDKPDAKKPENSPCSESTPASVYGHTGFTGTCAWVDPDNKLIYVFLSNRIYPQRWNSKLFRLDIRTRIQEEAYKKLVNK